MDSILSEGIWNSILQERWRIRSDGTYRLVTASVFGKEEEASAHVQAIASMIKFFDLECDARDLHITPLHKPTGLQTEYLLILTLSQEQYQQHIKPHVENLPSSSPSSSTLTSFLNQLGR